LAQPTKPDNSVRCPRLVLRGVDRANCEEFTAQLGPPSRRVLTDRQFAYAATFVSWVDLDEAILRVDGWVVKRGPTRWSSTRRSSSSVLPWNAGATTESVEGCDRLCRGGHQFTSRFWPRFGLASPNVCWLRDFTATFYASRAHSMRAKRSVTTHDTSVSRLKSVPYIWRVSRGSRRRFWSSGMVLGCRSMR